MNTGLSVGVELGLSDGVWVASAPLNSSPGAPYGNDGSMDGWLDGEEDGVALGFAEGVMVGSLVLSSISAPPCSKAIGEPDGSKLTEGISDSHHFPRTFVISSPREPA